MTTFLACPFCGCSDIDTDGPCYTQPMCNGCGAQVYDQPSRDDAIAAWNRRASPQPHADGVEDAARAGGTLIAALRHYGFPVSEAASLALYASGSREAQALNDAALAFAQAVAALSPKEHG